RCCGGSWPEGGGARQRGVYRAVTRGGLRSRCPCQEGMGPYRSGSAPLPAPLHRRRPASVAASGESPVSLPSASRASAPAEPDDYLDRRRLRRGSAGWLLLTGLGVAYVVSGDYSGWNFGLAEGGFGGLAIAMVLMGTMYACMVFALAELSSILPTAGGGYGF